MDGNCSMSIIALLNMCEDAITEHMGSFGLDGLTVKQKHNILLVFTKNKIEIGYLPPWLTNLTVNAWISKITPYKLFLNCSIMNSDIMVAQSKTEVVGIDMFNYKLKKVYEYGVVDSLNEENELDINYDIIKMLECKDLVCKRCVKATNIDYINHTNNVEYIRFILDTMSLKDIKKIKSIEMIYSKQSFINDELSIYKTIDIDFNQFRIEKNNETINITKIKFGE